YNCKQVQFLEMAKNNGTGGLLIVLLGGIALILTALPMEVWIILGVLGFVIFLIMVLLKRNETTSPSNHVVINGSQRQEIAQETPNSHKMDVERNEEDAMHEELQKAVADLLKHRLKVTVSKRSEGNDGDLVIVSSG